MAVLHDMQDLMILISFTTQHMERQHLKRFIYKTQQNFTTEVFNFSPTDTVKFQIAYSSNGINYSQFLGPDGTTGSYFISGQDIPDIFENNQYIKIKVMAKISDQIFIKRSMF
jgi:hypothetical protein